MNKERKMLLYILAHDMLEDRESNLEHYNELGYFERCYVDRIYNNLIRENYY